MAGVVEGWLLRINPENLGECCSEEENLVTVGHGSRRSSRHPLITARLPPPPPAARVTYTPAKQAMGPHVAALGMRFYRWQEGQMFPSAYDNSILIAQHGSWDRTLRIGYRCGRRAHGCCCSLRLSHTSRCSHHS